MTPKAFGVEDQACQRMGTPRASVSLDQIRNVQSNESRGGENATDPMSIWPRWESSQDWRGRTATTVGAQMALVSSTEWLLASGCDEGAVFFGDVAQQVMLAQQRA